VIKILRSVYSIRLLRVTRLDKALPIQKLFRRALNTMLYGTGKQLRAFLSQRMLISRIESYRLFHRLQIMVEFNEFKLKTVFATDPSTSKNN
jgi:hypothetical protein